MALFFEHCCINVVLGAQPSFVPASTSGHEESTAMQMMEKEWIPSDRGKLHHSMILYLDYCLATVP